MSCKLGAQRRARAGDINEGSIGILVVTGTVGANEIKLGRNMEKRKGGT